MYTAVPDEMPESGDEEIEMKPGAKVVIVLESVPLRQPLAFTSSYIFRLSWA